MTAYIAALSNVCGEFRGHQKYIGMAYDLRDRIDKPVGDAFAFSLAAFNSNSITTLRSLLGEHSDVPPEGAEKAGCKRCIWACTGNR